MALLNEWAEEPVDDDVEPSAQTDVHGIDWEKHDLLATRVYVRTETDPDVEPFLRALPQVTLALQCLRSGMTSTRKHSARSKARNMLRRAIEALEEDE